MSRAALTAATIVISAAIAALLLGTVARKTLRILVERRRARLHDVARPVLVALMSGQRVPGSLSRPAAEAVEALAVQALGTVRGEAAVHLAMHLRAVGLVDRMRRQLARRGAVRRARAAEALGALRAHDAVDDLVNALGDRSPEVRQTAARALGKVGGDRAAAALLDALDGPRSLPAGQVAMALVAIGVPTVAPARAALAGDDPTARYVAAQLLGHLEALDAVGDLASALGRPDLPQLRTEVATALGRIGSPAATPALLAACRAAEPEVVRGAAAVALGRIGAAEAIGPLTSMLDAPGHVVPHAAARALVDLGVAGRSALVGLVAAGGTPAAHAAEALAMGPA